ncbi:MAG: hypothetical protein CML03_01020 [Pseudooceanicola sp.]|nr:hypothetical protein [Pseudooceanicola sp.]|tara:strand:- start:1338 stop:1649 length:312 start_codon:yes stop_codon:yes gene_type:complete
MSTNEYLSKLDFDQLVYARDSAQRLIDKKLQEKKIPVWRVTDGFVVYGNFADDDYLLAAKSLVEVAADLDARRMREKLSIEKEMIRESEYSDYVKPQQGKGEE